MVDFRYYINRQGPRGQQGAKGEQGYSPQVIVGKNTASEFTLKVINEDGSFETENLKVVPENRGGTYVRYDKDTYQEYIGDPDIATTSTFGVVRLATKEDLGTQEESRAVTSALLDTYLQENYLNKVHGDVVTGTVSFRGNTGFLNAPHIDKIKDEVNNQYITRNVSNYTTKVGSLTVPDDITARMVQGGKEIAYTSDLAEFVTNAVLNSAISNLVTLDTDQQISGKKNFANGISLNSVIQFNVPIALIKGDKSGLDIILGAYDDRLMIGSQNTRPIKLNSDSITDYNGNNLLSYANVVAGDNIAIEKTSTGVKVSSTGGGVGDVTLAGDNSFTGNNTFDGETTFNAHTWTAEQEAVNLNVTSLATMKNVNVSGTLTSNGEINAVSINAAGIKNNQNNKYYLTQGSITPGDNVIIEETTDGIKISSTGGGGGASINDSTTSSTSTWSSSKINSTKNDNIFDIGKFTVVGNPTITNDGVVSGFGSGNYIDCDTIQSPIYNYEEEIRFYYTSNSEQVIRGVQSNLHIGWYLRTENNGRYRIAISAVGSPDWQIDTGAGINGFVTQNAWNYIKFIWDGTKYKFYSKTDDTEYTLLYSFPSSIPMIQAHAILGNAGQWNFKKYFTGSIDLNAFKIYGDGKEVFNGLMESTKPIYDKITSTNTALTTFQTDTDNNFSAVNSALNEKANLSDLSGYVTVNKYNELLARVVALETEINGGIA